MGNQLSLDVSSVPKEWLIIPCGVFFKVKSIKNTEGEMNLSVYRDYGVIPKDSRNDNHNRVSEDTSSYKLVDPGDFVLNKMKCWSGSLGVSNYRGIVSPSYTVLEPIKEIDNKYFHYLLRSETYRQIYESLSYGVRIGQWELRYHDFKQIPSLYPPIEEQKLISHYLDKKTSQIDLLVDKVEKKIDLLEEQKTSLINEVATKGLNPNVEMKDSGVEWIGEIPSNWECIRLGMLGDFSSSGIDKKSNNDETPVKMVNYTDIIQGRKYYPIQTGKKKYMKVTTPQSKLEEHRLVKGDMVLIPSSETHEDLGYSSLIDFEEKDIVYSYHIVRYKTKRPIYHYFKKYLINHHSVLNQFSSGCKGTTRQIIGRDVFNNVRVLLPPISEQEQIVEYLDEQTKKIDKTILVEEKRIELLKEYKKSLISEVVTGKKRVI